MALSKIDTAAIAADAVDSSQIADDAVTDGKIADGAGQYHPFIGFQQFTQSHNASGTIDWANQPTNGATLPSGVGFEKNESSSTYNWNGSTFTCKSAGVYFVYATVIPHNSTGSMYLYIRKNGTSVTDNRSSGGAIHENVYSQALVDLAVNDTITIYTSANVHGGLYGNVHIFKIGEA